ncbi:MAG TPA: SIS domain-containing protein [Candidatus Methylomirabilis sp.]|nr:SIS domain-containing protein [Candidatus Methylomirabilis sp.]
MIQANDVRAGVRSHLDRLRSALDNVSVAAVEAVVRRLYSAYLDGRKVLIAGNGGSAATASHMACDLSKSVFDGYSTVSGPKGRLKVMALTDNVPLITAWANDTDYSRVFVEQVRTHVDRGDVLIAISGSGKSPSVVEAVKLARGLGAHTVGILGFDGGELIDLVDVAIVVRCDDYGVVEDVHMALDHILTECLRRLIAAAEPRPSEDVETARRAGGQG